jgi:single-strand DNA-binding protein
MSLANKVILDGNIGADPEIRYTPDGKSVANVRLATNESYKDKTTGERKTLTEWHRLVFFGPSAETIKEFAKKGTSLKIEGYLRTRKWEKGDQTHYSTEIIVDEFRFGQKLKSDDPTTQTEGISDINNPDGGKVNEDDQIPF